MVMSPTDPNEVRLTGENSFIRLSQGGGDFTTRASHWRVWFSPAGMGCVLLLQSELTDGQTRIYSDNIALARWLQEELESQINPPNADPNIPVIEATFSRTGDSSSFWTEYISSDDAEISMTWHDFIDPFIVRVEAGTRPTGPHGVYSCFIPAKGARLTVNGQQAAGSPQPQERDGHTSSTAALAISESWVRPA
jgi:hypothetical protein